MSDNFIKITFVDMVYIHGQIKDNIQEIGQIIKWTGKEFSNGMMVEYMKDHINKIKKKVKVNLYGQMEELMKGNGMMGNNMEQGNIEVKKVYGDMVEGINGQMKIKKVSVEQSK